MNVQNLTGAIILKSCSLFNTYAIWNVERKLESANLTCLFDFTRASITIDYGTETFSISSDFVHYTLVLSMNRHKGGLHLTTTTRFVIFSVNCSRHFVLT